MNFLRKIQGLPETTRKIILLVIVIILGMALLFWWVKTFQQRLKSFKPEEFRKELKIPSLEEELKEMPKLKIPEPESYEEK